MEDSIVMILMLQVLAGTEILSRTGESLSRAQQVAIETDEVGQFWIFTLNSLIISHLLL